VRGTARRFDANVRRSLGLSYLLYEPQHAGRKGERSPLVVFLHGMGERGYDLSKVTMHGPPLLAENGRAFPFFLAVPQCPADSSWFFQLDALRGLLADLVRRLPVDTSRICLTGLSMGGFGSWHMAVEYPHAFSAVVPICGGSALASGLDQRLGAMAHVPVWAFHGAKDNVVPIILQQVLVERLRAAGGTVQFTVYPDAEHDSWTATYANQQVYDWMLAQKNTDFRL
jgi:predicted peptidase